MQFVPGIQDIDSLRGQDHQSFVALSKKLRKLHFIPISGHATDHKSHSEPSGLASMKNQAQLAPTKRDLI